MKARAPSTEDARFEAPREVWCGEGVFPSPPDVVWGGGYAPIPENFFSDMLPPRKIFRFLSSKRQVWVHPRCYFLQLINLN